MRPRPTPPTDGDLGSRVTAMALTFSLAALALTFGCDDDALSTGPVFALVTPGFGESFSADDDTNPNLDGVQVSVGVRVSGYGVGHVELISRPEGSPGLTSSKLIVVPSSGTYSTNSLTLYPGVNRITARLSEGTRLAATDEIAATLEGPSPTLAITAPLQGATLNASDRPLRVAVRLEGTEGADKVWIETNGHAGDAVKLTGRYAVFEIAPPEGSVKIEAVAELADQKIRSSTLVIQVDTIAPSVGLSPTESAAPAVSLEVSCDEEGTDVTLMENGGIPRACGDPGHTLATAACTAGEVVYDLVLSEGAHKLDVCSVDEAGNVGRDTADVVIDTTPPQVVFQRTRETLRPASDPDADPDASFYQATIDLDCESGSDVTVVNDTSGELVEASCPRRGVLQVEFTLTPGLNTLSATAVDALGNAGSAPHDAAVTLAIDACGLALTHPTEEPWLLGPDDDLDGDPSNGVDVAIEGLVYNPACVGMTASLEIGGELISGVVEQDGTLSIPVTLADETSTDFTLAVGDGDGHVDVVGPFAVEVQLGDPTITCVGGSPQLFGLADDLEPGGDLDVDLRLSVGNGAGGTVTVDAGPLGEVQTLDVDGPTPLSVRLSLPHQAPGEAPHAIALTATNRAGHTTTATCELAVDLVAPDVVTHVEATLDNPRLGTLEIVFDPASDDALGVAAVDHYEIRRSTQSIASDADFFAAELAERIDAPVLGSTVLATLPELPWAGAEPPSLTHTLAIRAFDEVGNPGPLETFTEEMTLAEVAFRDAGAPAGFGAKVAAIGDIDSDGNDDLFVSNDGTSGSGWIVLGRPDPSELDDPTLTLPLLTGPTDGGFGLAAQALGDVNGDGDDDFAVAAPQANDGDGAVFVYLGVAVGSVLDTEPDVQIDGVPGSGAGLGLALAGGGNFSDLGSEGLDDIVAATAIGQVHVIAGRNGWSNAAPLLHLSISDSASDNMTAGIMTINEEFAGSDLGAAMVMIDDVDSDGLDELLVGAPCTSAACPGRVHLITGPSAFPAAPLIATSDGHTLHWEDLGQSCDDGLCRFGASLAASGATVVVGESGADLFHVVTFGGGAPAVLTTTVRRTPGGYGSSLAVADVNGDGALDVLAAAIDSGHHGSLGVHLFDGITPYAETDISYVDRLVDGQASGWAQSIAALGDFNGDSYADFAVAQSLAGNGRVVLVY